jgi:cell division protein FtsA
VAERIKVEYGTCQKGRDVKEKIDIGEEEPLVFSQKQLADIIEPRVSEIFREVNKELKKISREKLLPGGIVLTGGGAKISGITDLVKKELKLPCRIGKIHGFSGLKEDPSWATVCGLVLSGSDLEGEKSSIFPDFKIGAFLKKFFKNFVP